jgi:hypothetical protein
MYREISDLGLFIQTSPYGLGLYKKYFRYISVQTEHTVNKKLIIKQVYLLFKKFGNTAKPRVDCSNI